MHSASNLSETGLSEASPEHPRPRSRWIGFFALLFFTILLRGGLLAATWDRLDEDPDEYRAIAKTVVQYGIYGRVQSDGSVSPTAYRPPLYPLILSKLAFQGHVTPLAVALLHLVLGTMTVVLVYWLAQLCNIGRLRLPAAMLVACDPILLNQSTLVMTETLATFLAVVALICLIRHAQNRCWRTAALAGGMLALAMLCRPLFALPLALSAVVVFWIAPTWPRRFLNAAVYGLAALLMLAPWAARNYQYFGKPIVTTTHGGYTFALGNNEFFYQYLRRHDKKTPWDSEEFKRQLEQQSDTTNSADEPARDHQIYQQAWQVVRSQPAMFAYASLYRVGQLWNPLPHRGYERESKSRLLLRWAIGVWYTAVFLLAAIGILSLRGRCLRSPWLWGMLFCLSFTAVHTFYWSDMRMRAPLMPVVYLLAAVGGELLASRMKIRK